jgi:uncharacterized protein YecE (DUF72 family)
MGDWGYLRLRRADYSDADLKGWAERIQALPWREAFVFFKHEDAGKGAQFAERFTAAWGHERLTTAPADGRPAAASPLPASTNPRAHRRSRRPRRTR